MAGNNNSGRKIRPIEQCATDCINLGWKFLKEEMQDNKLSRDIKREIALRLCAKNVPQNLNVNPKGLGNTTNINLYGIKSDDYDRIAEDILKKRNSVSASQS
jgi:hypothetical protein